MDITVQPNGGQSIQTGSEASDPLSWTEGCQPADIHR
jgi:hypothetical protein